MNRVRHLGLSAAAWAALPWMAAVAALPNPIGPVGNISAVLDNNNHGVVPGDRVFPINDGPTNATMGFTNSLWGVDPTDFAVGSIEYDFWLQSAPSGGLTYVDNRLGFSTAGGVSRPAFVSTAPADTLLWYALRADDSGVGSISPNGIPGLVGGSEAPLVGALNHLKIDLLAGGFHKYTLNGTEIMWEVDTGGGTISTAMLPNFAGAPGVNTMTFVGDFSGADPAAPHGYFWVDNITAAPASGPAATIDFEGSTPMDLPTGPDGFALHWIGDFNSPDGYLWQAAEFIPEPNAMLLAGLGLIGALPGTRRRRYRRI